MTRDPPGGVSTQSKGPLIPYEGTGGSANLSDPHGGGADRRSRAADSQLGGRIPSAQSGAHQGRTPALLEPGYRSDPADPSPDGDGGRARSGDQGPAGDSVRRARRSEGPLIRWSVAEQGAVELPQDHVAGRPQDESREQQKDPQVHGVAPFARERAMTASSCRVLHAVATRSVRVTRWKILRSGPGGRLSNALLGAGLALEH